MALILLCFCNSFLTASCRGHAHKDSYDCKTEGYNEPEQKFKFNGSFNRTVMSEDDCPNCPDSSKSFGETQLDLFHHRHGLLLLHLAAAIMFSPSLAAWLQVNVLYMFPCLADIFRTHVFSYTTK